MPKQNKRKIEKIDKFIVGVTASLARMEKKLGLKPMTAQEYKQYLVVKGGSSTFSDESLSIGDEIFSGAGFFDWINDNVVSPVYNNTLRPVVDNVVAPVVTSEAFKTLAPLAVHALGGNQGGAYPVEYSGAKYDVERGRAYPVEGKAYNAIAAKVNENLLPQTYTTGKIYVIDGAKMMYDGNKFVYAPPDAPVRKPRAKKGAAYLDSNGNVVVAAKEGLLGSTGASSKKMKPSDFLQ